MKGAQQGTQPRSHILRWQSCHILGHQTAQQLQSRALPCPCRGSCTACSGGGVRSSSAATRPCCRSSVRTSPACCYLTASAGTFVVLPATVLAPATAVTVAGTSHSSAARSAAGMPVTLHPLSGRKHRANFEPLLFKTRDASMQPREGTRKRMLPLLCNTPRFSSTPLFPFSRSCKCMTSPVRRCREIHRPCDAHWSSLAQLST